MGMAERERDNARRRKGTMLGGERKREGEVRETGSGGWWRNGETGCGIWRRCGVRRRAYCEAAKGALERDGLRV